MGMNQKAISREGTPAGEILNILRNFQIKTRSIIANAEVLADALGAAWLDATGQAVLAHHRGIIGKLGSMKFGRSDQEQMLINECIQVLIPRMQEPHTIVGPPQGDEVPTDRT